MASRRDYKELNELISNMERNIRQDIKQLQIRIEDIVKEIKTIQSTADKALENLSSETLEERKKMKPYAQKLYDNGILFSWGAPATILIFKNGKLLKASNLEEAEELLHKLNITVEEKKQQEEEEGEEGEEEKEKEEEEEEGKE
ncbi:hypothetical protein lerEdw1_019908 [Lerista edwardsae]|nr:hypothetical protein lerEdw1_019908 [Lerista edwardsae]